MSPYKLKELRNMEKHEQAVFQHVKKNVTARKNNKWIPVFVAIMSVAIVAFLVLQFSPASMKTQHAASDVRILEVFEQIDGDGVVASEAFKVFDDHRNYGLRFYFKPVTLNHFTFANNVTFPDLPAPFQKNTGEVIAVNDGSQTELQFHFKNNEGNFLNISMSKYFMNSVHDVNLEMDETDSFGNKLTKLSLTDDTLLYHLQQTTNSGYTFSYFHYNEASNKINVTATRANEFYTYYNGFIYQIGYTGDVNTEEMTDFVTQFIKTNEMQYLPMEHPLIETIRFRSGEKAIFTASCLLLFGIGLTAFFTRHAKRKTKWIAWGAATMLVIAPLLSWLLSFIYGIFEGDGFAVIGMLMLLLPLFFLVGLVIIVVGLFKKF
ncbi:MAG: hypothetical protein RR588_01450 [Solibacillus sp.]